VITARLLHNSLDRNRFKDEIVQQSNELQRPLRVLKKRDTVEAQLGEAGLRDRTWGVTGRRWQAEADQATESNRPSAAARRATMARFPSMPMTALPEADPRCAAAQNRRRAPPPGGGASRESAKAAAFSVFSAA